MHQPLAYEALANQEDALVSVYIDYVTYFNRINSHQSNKSIEYCTYYVPLDTTVTSVKLTLTKLVIIVL